MTEPCRHLDQIADVPPPRDVCEICITIGSGWHHLRQCMTCAVTLCCDTSPNQHMSAHYREAGHPIMRSGQPDEDWAWCFVDDVSLQRTDDGWLALDPFLEEGSWMASAHMEAGGDLELADDFETVDGFPLGRWIGYARERRAAGALDAREIASVESLAGWHW